MSHLPSGMQGNVIKPFYRAAENTRESGVRPFDGTCPNSGIIYSSAIMDYRNDI